MRNEEKSSGRRAMAIRIIVGALGYGLLLLDEINQAVGYCGLLLIFLALGWTWKIKKVPVGRLLAVLLVIWAVSCDYSTPPDPLPVPNLRGQSSTVSDIDFSISGVKPGMRQEDVERLLGPGTETEESTSYKEGKVFVHYWGGEVGSVRGEELLDGNSVFFKAGQPMQKVLSTLGPPQWSTEPGHASYTALDPDLEIWYKDDKIEYLEL